jgi:phosphoglycerate dehydrogenase-like enzyme
MISVPSFLRTAQAGAIHPRRLVAPGTLGARSIAAFTTSRSKLPQEYYHQRRRYTAEQEQQHSGSITSLHADPAMVRYKYWSREESEAGQFATVDPESVTREANIISLSDPGDVSNAALDKGQLPNGSKLLGIGMKVEDFDADLLKKEPPNIVYVSPSCAEARSELPKLLKAYPSLDWVHCRSAGIDFVVSQELADSRAYVTNAKGQFSSTLAEYTMMACSYFAKDLPRLMRQKKNKEWDKYDVEELRGKTMGIVGYGDIGRACAKLAHVYGMRIIALRRNPELCEGDALCDVVYGTGSENLNKLISESDYVVCSAPSTLETERMVNATAFQSAKEGMVFINLGRGRVVDEDALIEALKNGQLKGAALDVFAEEPLPQKSDLWELDNVLISPHNMDQTSTFMHEACEFFVNENLPRFICEEELLNPVDKVLGY